MKYLTLLLLLAPYVGFSQTQEDAEVVMTKFVRYFNKHQTDNICNQFEPNEKMGCSWAKTNPEEVYNKYGKITFYRYLGIDQSDAGKVTVYKIVSQNKGTKTMSFTLNEKHQFGTFRLDTTSDEIEQMLKKAK